MIKVFFRLTLLLMLPLLLFSQKGKKYNDHISYRVDTSRGEYNIDFHFMDNSHEMRNLSLGFPVDRTNGMIMKFGIPESMFDRFLDTEENRIKRREILSNGMFRQNGSYLVIDKNAVIAYYAPVFCKPIADWIASTLSHEGIDNRINRIEMAMSLVQDIPYAIPEDKNNSIYTGGMLTPPEILIYMFGDCDSKAILFAGILSYLIDSRDIVFLNQKNHVLTAVKGRPDKGHTYIKYKGESYLLSETAGPGKRRLGEKGDYFRNEFEVEPVVFSCDVIPTQESNTEMTVKTGAAEIKVIIKNTSSRQFRFQFSDNGKNWQDLFLDPKHYTGLSTNGAQEVYIRMKSSKGKYFTYNLQPGKEYNASYHTGKRRWELFVF